MQKDKNGLLKMNKMERLAFYQILEYNYKIIKIEIVLAQDR